MVSAVALGFAPTIGAAAAPNNVQQSQLAPYIKLAEESRRAIGAVRDYEALFTRRELVGRTRYDSEMQMKFREVPFSVYLRFLSTNAGREVVYVDGANNGNLLAHEPPGTLRALAGIVALPPNSPQAMAEGRHPISRIGMQKMVEGLLEQWRKEERLNNPQDPKCEYFPAATLGDLKCKVARTTRLQTRPGEFYQTLLFIDNKTNFPVRLEQWGFDATRQKPYLIEEYTYSKIRTNVGLNNFDFDVNNRMYGFK